MHVWKKMLAAFLAMVLLASTVTVSASPGTSDPPEGLPQITPMSLQPLEEYSATLDLTGYLPEELEEIPVHPLYPDGVPIGRRDAVHTGPATILSTVGTDGMREYDVEIVEVARQSQPAQRSMVLRVTDPELLERTGGIVQGMSGSPILQDGRLIGAVTHVFVNDPTMGYGLFIEWMLAQENP